LKNQFPKITFIKEKSAIPFYHINKCIATPGISDSHTVVKRFLDSKKKVVCDVELFVQKNTLPMICVTGTNGKSTVVTWLSHVLTNMGKKVILAGNIGVPVLDFLNGEQNHESIFDMVVLELSSFQLERMRSQKGHTALILNLSPDHMDRYKSLEDYKAAKEKIYLNAKAIVVNHDATNFSVPYKAQKITFSIDKSADFTIKNVLGQRYIAHQDKQLLPIGQLPLIGEHNVANALAVLACVKSLNLDIDAAVKVLLDFKGLPHRTEFVAEIDSVRYVNDSKATNANATAAAVAGDIDSLILIVGGDSKQADLSILPKVLKNKLKLVIALGQDAGLFKDLLSPIATVEIVETLKGAVLKASQRASSGDTVLLSPACSSLDMFKNYIERGNVFKEAVLELSK